MQLTRYEFEILTFLEKNGNHNYDLRSFSDTLKISGSEIENSIKKLSESGLVCFSGKTIDITRSGLESLEPYRVKNAIIMAAGFGERMLPVTLVRPKPMVRVNGVRIIDTLLDALIAAEIENIYIVRGYKKEVFDELIEKYPSVHLIDNDEYKTSNNISSIMRVIDKLDFCYICEADLYVSNPDVIKKYQYSTNILGSYSLETDDWCFKMVDGCARDFQKGNTFCFNEYGISFWDKKDSEELRKDYTKVYNEFENGKNYFWDFIPLILFKEKYKVEIRECLKSDIIEIDSYHELQELDSSYKK